MNLRGTLLISIASSMLCLAPARAIVNGQFDTFEDGTSEFWGYGLGDWLVKPGGPGGMSDNYMELFADGSGFQGKFVAFNRSQWLGNYTAAQVNAIEMDIKAFSIVGAPNVNMRLAFRSSTAGGSPGYVTTFAATITADGQWHHAVFRFSTLTAVGVPPPLATVLAGPAEVRIMNSTSPNTVTGDNVAGFLGIDNIHAFTDVSILSTTRLSGGTIRVQGKGVANTTYTIEATPDLVQTFAAIGTAAAAADGTFQFDDINASGFTQRFYRVKTP